MKKYSFLQFILRGGVLFLCTAILLASCSSSVGGDGGAYDDSPTATAFNRGAAISIVTGNGANGRAAAAEPYEITVALKASGYSDSQTATVASGGSQTFRFSGVPYEKPVTASVTIKVGSLILFSGSQTKELSDTDNTLTVNLANQLGSLITINDSLKDDAASIFAKIPAGSSPSVVIDSTSVDVADIVGKLASSPVAVTLCLANVSGKTSYSAADVTAINSCANISKVQIPSSTVTLSGADTLEKFEGGAGTSFTVVDGGITGGDSSLVTRVKDGSLPNVSVTLSSTSIDVNAELADEKFSSITLSNTSQKTLNVNSAGMTALSKISGSNVKVVVNDDANGGTALTNVKNAAGLTGVTFNFPTNTTSVETTTMASIADAKFTSVILPATGCTVQVDADGASALSKISSTFNGTVKLTAADAAATAINKIDTNTSLSGITLNMSTVVPALTDTQVSKLGGSKYAEISFKSGTVVPVSSTNVSNIAKFSGSCTIKPADGQINDAFQAILANTKSGFTGITLDCTDQNFTDDVLSNSAGANQFCLSNLGSSAVSRITKVLVKSGTIIEAKGIANDTAAVKKLSGSGVTVRIFNTAGTDDASRFTEIAAGIKGSNLTNVTLDLNGMVSTVSAVSNKPTNVISVILTGVTRINTDAFKGWTGLTGKTVSIPATVTEIGNYAFATTGYASSSEGCTLNYTSTGNWYWVWSLDDASGSGTAQTTPCDWTKSWKHF